MATKPTTVTFTYHDPGRTFDGTPYEAAGKSVEQSRRVLRLFARAIQDSRVQVRNAYLQDQIDRGEEPDAEAWPESPKAKALGVVAHDLDRIGSALLRAEVKLKAVERAASYDPGTGSDGG